MILMFMTSVRSGRGGLGKDISSNMDLSTMRPKRLPTLSDYSRTLLPPFISSFDPDSLVEAGLPSVHPLCAQTYLALPVSVVPMVTNREAHSEHRTILTMLYTCLDKKTHERHL